MPANQVRWGILGTGSISGVMAKAIHEAKLGELVAVGGRSQDKAQAFAREFMVPTCHDSYEAVLADPNVDVVYIGLPNHLHKEWIMRCAEARKHILCEKPLVTNLEDAQAALAAAKKANVFCMEALMYRCHPLTAKLVELIKQKVIGEVCLLNASYVANIADVADPIDGGAIQNLGCYPVSLIRLLAGVAHNRQTAEPSNVISLGEMDHSNKNVQRASAILHFPKRMLATVTVADDIKTQTHFSVIGTEGQLQVLTNPWMPTQQSKILVQRNDGTTEEMMVHAEQSLYVYQIDFVSQAILNGETNAEAGGMSWLDTLGNVIVLDAWNKQVQAKTGNTDEVH